MQILLFTFTERVQDLFTVSCISAYRNIIRRIVIRHIAFLRGQNTCIGSSGRALWNQHKMILGSSIGSQIFSLIEFAALLIGVASECHILGLEAVIFIRGCV